MDLTGIIAILSVFGFPVAIVFVVNYFKLRNRQLELMHKEPPKELVAMAAERKLLEERVQNLESIVCSVDFELNQRLNRLAAAESTRMRALPAPAATAAAGAPAEPLASQDSAPAPGGTLVATAKTYQLGQLEVGRTVLGRYNVVRELGRGGMGAVYQAVDTKLEETVALKVISSLPCDDPQAAAERFRREVHAARRVTHPNVIRIHDLGEDGPLLFLSMEYVEGETLAARIRRAPPAYEEALRILRAVGEGVSAAHKVGVVHRDLKPQNVLLGRDPSTVKVIDFGLATASFFAGMTASGMILGTPEYMAPEQLRGAPCDARTDVYALGAVSYHLFCGRPPFGGDTPIAVGFAHLTEPVPSPRERCTAMSDAVARVITRSLAKLPSERFASAGEFTTELDKASRG